MEIQEVAAALPARPAEAHKNNIYNPLVAAEIVVRVSNGETLSQICKKGGMPGRDSFHSWVLAHPDLAKAWDAARRLKAHSLFDEALDMARDLKTRKFGRGDSATVNALRVAVETLKWSASKLNPQEYGERALPTPAIAIQIITGLDLNLVGPERVGDTGMFDYTVKARMPELTLAPSPDIIEVPKAKRPYHKSRRRENARAKAPVPPGESAVGRHRMRGGVDVGGGAGAGGEAPGGPPSDDGGIPGPSLKEASDGGGLGGVDAGRTEVEHGGGEQDTGWVGA